MCINSQAFLSLLIAFATLPVLKPEVTWIKWCLPNTECYLHIFMVHNFYTNVEHPGDEYSTCTSEFILVIRASNQTEALQPSKTNSCVKRIRCRCCGDGGIEMNWNSTGCCTYTRKRGEGLVKFRNCIVIIAPLLRN